jgi:hypothetical protein
MKKLFKFLLITTFFSYYFVAIALNFPLISNHLNLLGLTGDKALVHVSPETYLGKYPTVANLEDYKRTEGIKRVITLMDPEFPISRELVKSEKKYCKTLGIEYIVIPIALFSKNPMDYMIIRDFLDEEKKKTLIHAYFYDDRLLMLEKILKRY